MNNSFGKPGMPDMKRQSSVPNYHSGQNQNQKGGYDSFGASQSSFSNQFNLDAAGAGAGNYGGMPGAGRSFKPTSRKNRKSSLPTTQSFLGMNEYGPSNNSGSSRNYPQRQSMMPMGSSTSISGLGVGGGSSGGAYPNMRMTSSSSNLSSLPQRRTMAGVPSFTTGGGHMQNGHMSNGPMQNGMGGPIDNNNNNPFMVVKMAHLIHLLKTILME
ncbi:unnamed protein product [[Candida] boidinii]|nr:unnamed protein product [[Candida] boidinii]